MDAVKKRLKIAANLLKCQASIFQLSAQALPNANPEETTLIRLSDVEKWADEGLRRLKRLGASN